MNRRAIFTIFTIVLTDLIGFGIIIPILPAISQSMGVRGFWLGLLISSYAIAQFISAPILGNLSDRYGRKPILVISKLGTVIAYIIFAFSRSFSVLLISRLIDGFTGGNIPAARAYISDITTKENRSRGMAIIGISFGLGFIIGPALGGIFFTIGKSHTLPALVGALLSFISLVLTQVFLDESHRLSKPVVSRTFSIKNFLKVFENKTIQQILIIQFIIMTATSGFQTTISFFTDKIFRYTPQQNSLMFVYFGVLGLVVQGYLASRRGPNVHRMIKIGIIVNAAGIIFLSLSPTSSLFLASIALTSAGGGLIGVFLPTLLSTVDSKDPEGEVMGAYEGIGSLGRVIGPAIIGSLIVIFPRQIYFTCGIAVLATIFFLKKINLKPQYSKPYQGSHDQIYSD
ncbi:MAG: MFS transporter [Candidatus Shapirobacteria bacterium]|jgi:DHA1 family tetracycline resistance protein-like MFS transporter